MSTSQDQDEISQLEKSPPSLYPDLTGSSLLTDTTPRRSRLETITHILSTDSIHHVLFIITLFLASAITYARAKPYDSNPGPRGERLTWLYALSTALSDVLRFQIYSFAALFLVREVHAISNAMRVGSVWMRKEESAQTRSFALGCLVLNILASGCFVFFKLPLFKAGQYCGDMIPALVNTTINHTISHTINQTNATVPAYTAHLHPTAVAQRAGHTGPIWRY